MDEQSQPQGSASTEDLQHISKKERREMRREEKRATNESARKSRSFRRIFIWIIAILAIGGATAGVTYWAVNSPADSTPGDNSPLANEVSSADWVRGNSSSAITFVEYGDFQCPACGQYHPMIKRLKDEFGKDIAFVFRHFPLSQVHPNAKDAAVAAEAAGAQGKFWEMHDILFERQNDWSLKPRPQSTFVSYAAELGLNIDQFEADSDRREVKDKIDEHYKTGVASGVNSTPTFFLNGIKLDNPKSYDDIQHTLVQAIAATATSTSHSTATSTNNETGS